MKVKGEPEPEEWQRCLPLSPWRMLYALITGPFFTFSLSLGFLNWACRIHRMNVSQRSEFHEGGGTIEDKAGVFVEEKERRIWLWKAVPVITRVCTNGRECKHPLHEKWREGAKINHWQDVQHASWKENTVLLSRTSHAHLLVFSYSPALSSRSFNKPQLLTDLGRFRCHLTFSRQEIAWASHAEIPAHVRRHHK